MAPENIRADLDQLGGYAGKTADLSDEVRQAATRHLANQHIGADMLGDLGEESGLHAHLSSAISGLHDAAHTSASYLGSLGEAVARARDDYQADERLHSERFRTIEREHLDGN